MQFKCFSPRNVFRNHLVYGLLRKYRVSGNLLDIGSGAGCWGLFAHKRGYKVALMDPSPAACSPKEGIGLLRCSVSEKEPGISYNIVTLMEVLEHINDDASFFKSVGNWIKPQGLLIITVPVNPRLWNISDELAGHFRRYT
ncbi:MAG: class I SAM-dependent methyltransferase, partial [Fibrobacterota bacterium]